MSISSQTVSQRLKYHPDAYQFVFAALRFTQQELGRLEESESNDEEAHVSGPELLEGIRKLALDQFGMLTLTVFRYWGTHSTEDFGRIVFELIERGEMRSTEQDQFGDFCSVYDFEEAFDRQCPIDVSQAFRQ